VRPLAIAIGNQPLNLLPSQANRHGLIAGATGTGKTVTLQFTNFLHDLSDFLY
jgi:Cdc6-like AAA superfamily ATPase